MTHVVIHEYSFRTIKEFISATFVPLCLFSAAIKFSSEDMKIIYRITYATIGEN